MTHDTLTAITMATVLASEGYEPLTTATLWSRATVRELLTCEPREVYSELRASLDRHVPDEVVGRLARLWKGE